MSTIIDFISRKLTFFVSKFVCSGYHFLKYVTHTYIQCQSSLKSVFSLIRSLLFLSGFWQGAWIGVSVCIFIQNYSIFFWILRRGWKRVPLKIYAFFYQTYLGTKNPGLFPSHILGWRILKPSKHGQMALQTNGKTALWLDFLVNALAPKYSVTWLKTGSFPCGLLMGDKVICLFSSLPNMKDEIVLGPQLHGTVFY